MITRFNIIISKMEVAPGGASATFKQFIYREDVSRSHLGPLIRQAESEHGQGTVYLEPSYLAAPKEYGVEY